MTASSTQFHQFQRDFGSNLLGCDAVSLGEWFLMFQRIVEP